MSANPEKITDADINEFVRTYSRRDGWRGAIGLYQSMLKEGPEIKALAETLGLKAPVLAVEQAVVPSLPARCRGLRRAKCAQ